ncbi:MAG TPA: alanyl-tRNA editing protein, partial [Terriglobia bacterium]|nr:alanyl-tRNA editing protein [Terriglobia bacterium]
MFKTERLYYTDCYLREFDARVMTTQPVGERFAVYLDRSAFYPASGGQPSDRGILGDAQVLDVVDEGETIAHIVDSAPKDETVRGSVDWRRRFDHMQQHTGQHVLSAGFEETSQLKTLSFHLGDDYSTVDLDSDRVSLAQIEEAESRANDVVYENRPVKILFRDASETQGMRLRKPTEREGEVRLIRIEDFDLSACGGTHVSRTGSVGQIAVRKVERLRDQTRIEFVCGGRALRSARSDFRILAETGLLLSTAREHIPDLVRKQSEELRTAVKATDKLTRRVASYRARELWSCASVRQGRKLIRCVFNSDESVEAKMIAQAAAMLQACAAFIGVRSEPTLMYFAQSA